VRQDDYHDDLAPREFEAPEHPLAVESDPLDFTGTHKGDLGSGTDALDHYAPAETVDVGTELDALDAQTGAAEEGATQDYGLEFFMVSNPLGTVAVSALMDGRTHRVELSARVAAMTESELAEEVIVLAELARQQGLAGQHTYVLDHVDLSHVDEIMNDLRLDSTEVLRDFMETGMGIPAPEQAEKTRAEVFASRYKDD